MNWVSELRVDPESVGATPVATDFVGTSVTSRTLVQPWQMPALLSENPHIVYGDCVHRGYTRMQLDRRRLTADLRATSTVLTRDAACATVASFVVEDGRATPVRV
jgi:alkaline phosphatase D